MAGQYSFICDSCCAAACPETIAPDPCGWRASYCHALESISRVGCIHPLFDSGASGHQGEASRSWWSSKSNLPHLFGSS